MRALYRFKPNDLIDNKSFIIKTDGSIYFVRYVYKREHQDEYAIGVTTSITRVDYLNIWTPTQSTFLDDVVGVINSEIDDVFRNISVKCEVVIEPVRAARNTFVPIIFGEQPNVFRVLILFEDGRSELVGTFNDEKEANKYMKYAQHLVQTKGHDPVLERYTDYYTEHLL